MNESNKKPITDIFIALLNLLGNPIYSSKNNQNSKLPLRARFIIMLSVTELFLGFISMYAHWNDTNRRFMVLLDIIFGGNAVIAITALIYNPNTALTLIDIMNYSKWFKNNKYIHENNIFDKSNKANLVSWNIAW